MRALLALVVLAASLSGCNLTSSQIANVACTVGATGAQVGVIVTSDAASGSNVAKAAPTAAQIQKTIADTCPVIVAGVAAANAAAGQ